MEKSPRIPSSRAKLNILQTVFSDTSQQKLVLHMLRQPRKCYNIEILAKIEGKEDFFLIFQGHIRLGFRSKKFKIISCLCTFNLVQRKKEKISLVLFFSGMKTIEPRITNRIASDRFIGKTGRSVYMTSLRHLAREAGTPPPIPRPLGLSRYISSLRVHRTSTLGTYKGAINM